MRLCSGEWRLPSRVLILIVAVATQIAPLHAQRAQPAATARDTVDRFVAAEMARKHIPGVSIAVVRRGRVVRADGYGVADLEHEVPVTPQTVFKIGSVSKQFLATGIMLLAQVGRLSVDDPVAKYFTDAPESWRGITLRHFLTHTSGVTREGPAFDPLKTQPDSVVIRSAFARPLEFPTGSKYQYCNVCYFTLADIIARVSGKPWDAFLAERVFRPTGMTATRTTTTTDLVPHRARGYTWSDSGYVNAPEFLALRPSGAFLSTVLDLAKWETALDRGGVLTPASRAAMWTPVRLTDGSAYGYGFGWELDSLDGHRQVHHGGSLPGFRAEFARFPNDSLAVIVLTNADGARPDEIARGVARIFLSTAAVPATSGGLRQGLVLNGVIDTTTRREPAIRGVIIERTHEQLTYTDTSGVRRTVPYSRIVVAEDSSGGWDVGRQRERTLVMFNERTILLNARGQRVTADELRSGRHVSVWLTGVVLTSKPAQASASKIVLN